MLGVDTANFRNQLAALPGWYQKPDCEHRFFTDEGVQVDLIPAGPKLLERGGIEWSDGSKMSLAGFDLAFQHRIVEDIADENAVGLRVSVPTAPVILLLKMCAWRDRPYDRDKDLQDISQLLRNYLADDDERHWTSAVVAAELDFEFHSAFCLGMELGAICQERHRGEVYAFLQTLSPSRLASLGIDSWKNNEDAAEQALGRLSARFRARRRHR